MTRASKSTSYPLAIPAGCFIAGVVLTLLWTSSSTPVPQPPAAADILNSTTDAFSSVAEALSTSTVALTNNTTHQEGLLTRDDLLIAIPSSLARSAACPAAHTLDSAVQHTIHHQQTQGAHASWTFCMEVMVNMDMSNSFVV